MVSIIMPAFNAANTIHESINSVISQTYKDWELIIINDGSSDNTLDQIRRFNDCRIKVLSQENRGVSFARNLGLKTLSGNYITFLDSDDIWDPSKLQIQVDFLNANQQIDLVHTDFFYFTDSIKNRHYKGYSEPYKSITDDYERLLINDFIVTSSVMLRAEVARNIGSFDPLFFGVEDWDYWIRVAKNYKISKIELCLTYYRENINGISKNLSRQLMQEKLLRKKHLGPTINYKIKKYSEWQFQKKKIYFHFISGNYVMVFFTYIIMLIQFPLNIESYKLIFKKLKG